MPVKYVVQRYARFPIYEPAEGGYYYEGREPDDYPGPLIVCGAKHEAVAALNKLVKEENEGIGEANEGYLLISPSGAYAYSVNHRYIGEGFDFFVEPMNRRGRHRKGYVPYC